LMKAFFDNVETNVDPALAQQLIRRIQGLTIKQMATLPGEDGRINGIGAVVTYDRERVESFLAETFGGEARDFSKAPGVRLLITNRSSLAGLEEQYKERLISMGLSEEQIVTRQAEPEPTLTRILATEDYWQEAEYFTSLLQTGRQQIDSIPTFEGQTVDLELVLGEDVVMTALNAQDVEVRTER
jgi:hypothetical protein